MLPVDAVVDAASSTFFVLGVGHWKSARSVNSTRRTLRLKGWTCASTWRRGTWWILRWRSFPTAARVLDAALPPWPVRTTSSPNSWLGIRNNKLHGTPLLSNVAKRSGASSESGATSRPEALIAVASNWRRGVVDLQTRFSTGMRERRWERESGREGEKGRERGEKGRGGRTIIVNKNCAHKKNGEGRGRKKNSPMWHQFKIFCANLDQPRFNDKSNNARNKRAADWRT